MKTRFLPQPRQALAIALLLPALLTLAVGVAMAVAGVARFQAEAFLANWAGKAMPPEMRAWQVAESAAQRSVAWYPVANGDYLDRLGRVYSWQFYQLPHGVAVMLPLLPPEEAAAVERSRRKALGAYRASVLSRPAWPGSWARLSHAKLYLLEVDGELMGALRKSGQLGENMAEVNREVAEVGLMVWSSLSASDRALVLQHAERASRSSTVTAAAIGVIIERAGPNSDLCAQVRQRRSAFSASCSR